MRRFNFRSLVLYEGLKQWLFQSPISLETDVNCNSTSYLIKEAVGYINQNYHRNITLEEVADSIHITASYLSFLFKKDTDVNFIKYLTIIRIEKAMELLANPKFKVYEVGDQVGFKNPRYFSYIFKKYTGNSPLQYRNSRMKSNFIVKTD